MASKSDPVETFLAEARARGLEVTVSEVKRPGESFFNPDGEKPKPRSKYRNTKVHHDGMTFDSIKEYTRWIQLKAEEEAGNITNLERQVRFPIEIAGIHICDYVSDFLYFRDGVRIVEDVKSEMTKKLPVYRLKKKLLAALNNIEIQEI